MYHGAQADPGQRHGEGRHGDGVEVQDLGVDVQWGQCLQRGQQRDLSRTGQEPGASRGGLEARREGPHPGCDDDGLEALEHGFDGQ